MKQTAKRILSAFLSLALMFSLCAVASAAGSITLEVGGSEPVSTFLSGDSYEWSSDDPSVASVSGRGDSATICGVGAGRATVTVTVTKEVTTTTTETVETGETDETGAPITEEREVSETTTEEVGTESWSVTVTEPAPPAREDLDVSIRPSSLSLTVGEGDVSLSASTRGEVGTVSYDWRSSNTRVADISGSGPDIMVTPLSAGTATISLKVTDDSQSASDSITVTVSAPELEELDVTISPSSGLDLTAGGKDGSLSASVTGAAGGISYSWVSTNTNVATVSGSSQSTTVEPLSAGSSVIRVTVTDRNGRSASDEVTVSVAKAQTTRVMASAGASTTLTMNAGDTQSLIASVSGGSGSYAFVWNASGAIDIVDQMRTNATIRGDDAGTGTVTLYVYDAEDNSNYDTVTWNVTVNGKSTPMSVSLSPATLSLNVAGSGTLSASASGGSGNSGSYNYSWSTNNGIVTVTGNGSAATVIAGSAGTAVVTVTVTDRSTNTSGKAACTVTVQSKDASYNASGTVTVGENTSITGAASSIASGFQKAFGVALSASASVRLTTPSAAIGQLRLSNGAQVAANTSYTYSQFSAMKCYATQAGSFSTAYTINDNGNVLSGTLTITASGGAAVSSVSINRSSVTLDTYSSYFLSLGILPSNAAYTVTWRSSNSNIAYVEGNGTSVTVYSKGRSGIAEITATVQSAGTGKKFERTCEVEVTDASNSTYNPSLTLTVGSDYYGTNLADNFRDRYRAVYGYALGDNATIRFSSLGTTNVAITRLSDGTAVRTNTNYSFAQYAAMSVTPVSAGTITASYSLTYNNNTLSGTITMYVRAANISVSISPSSMTLAPNSNQGASVTVTPANSYYTVTWSSSNTNVAKVYGNGITATVSSGSQAGTATIAATVTDRSGVKVVRSFVVTVRNQPGSVYNPSLSMTLGVNYTGTSLSSALAAQFQSVYNTALRNDSAKIRFSSLGNSAIAVTHLSDGRLISANTDYTFSQYIAMYVEPLSAGSFNVPYTLTYNGNSLSGTVMVTVAQGSISSSLNLIGTNPYAFRDATADNNAAHKLLSSAITNAVGSSWSFIRFSSFSDSVGTLYKDAFRASLNNENITASALENLYFVPAQTGKFSASFSVYNHGGGCLASGTLYISVSGSTNGNVSFNDVAASDWFSTPVIWAINRGITNGTSANTFSPYDVCTTAHILTFLWRSKGSPAPTISNPFSDVKASDYYYQAALWAYEKGLVSGSQFNGSQACTRASTVIFLWKLAGRPEAMSSGFTDVPANTETASAVNWAVAKGITNGMSAQSFSPATTCNRGQIVTFLYRAYA